MTRVLSELLGAREPTFRLGLRQLEQAAGEPSADIHLSSEIVQSVQAALRDLGLDPLDTTGEELYGVLLERVKADDKMLRKLLTAGSDDKGLTLRVQHLLDTFAIPKKTFAIKSSASKRLLKKNPPKKAMKQLGYRSIDSMLKHEPVAQVYAAAVIAEAPAWHRQLLSIYRQLLPTDFEVRDVTILAPADARWEKMSARYVADVKHNVMSFKELGVVVLLPLSADTIPGAALAVLLLTLRAISDIRITSTYLKLHQVRPDFGMIVAKSVRSEPYTQASLLGEPLPWQLIHRYFARSSESYSPELFEPHVQPEDLEWQPPEDLLAKLHERFEFWEDNAYLGLLDHSLPVSLNLTDAVLNFCNHLPYEKRIVHYFRDQLWHELMLRYLHQDNLKQVVQDQLNDELVDQAKLT